MKHLKLKVFLKNVCFETWNNFCYIYNKKLFMKKILFLIPLLFLLACTQTQTTNDVVKKDTIVEIQEIVTAQDTTLFVIDTIYKVVEYMPTFDGDLMKYLSSNITYPDSAKLNNIEGDVYVSFIVAHTGEVVQEAILRSSGNQYLDEEACRVVENMPKWNPGTQNGKTVSVFFVIPIKFHLH